MNWLKKMWVGWKGRKVLTQLVDIKSKYREPTFWVALLGNVASLLGAMKGLIDPKTALLINTAVTGLYNIARGAEKAQSQSVKPWWQSSEFYMNLGTATNNAFIDVQTGGFNSQWIAATSAFLTATFGANRDAANKEPEEAIAEGAKPILPVSK